MPSALTRAASACDAPKVAWEPRPAIAAWATEAPRGLLFHRYEVGADGKIAAAPETQACFAEHWANFAYGRTHDSADACVQSAVEAAFTESGYDVRALLLALTQTDAFLGMPAGAP